MGDRALNLVACQTLMALAPSLSSPRVRFCQMRYEKLISHTLAHRFAIRFKFESKLDKKFISSQTIADRFESYIGALWFEQGYQVVNSFLSPLFRDEIASQSWSDKIQVKVEKTSKMDQVIVKTIAHVQVKDAELDIPEVSSSNKQSNEDSKACMPTMVTLTKKQRKAQAALERGQAK
ncbi:hypothetical protein OIO90_004578 [Microbotryomycetes sp. JL221]|nr:hypothetical protein OIO90_004578 [Microbotryomycetes sp. JL221]